jgi:flagellar hook-basal body complex protein FliE
MTTPTAAASAYSALARLADPSAALGKAAGEGTSGSSFGSMLKDAIGSVIETGRKSDAQTHAMAAGGKSNIIDVVTAVSETEVAVQAMVSVRDKVIAAYEEIMRMPI